VNTDRKHLLRTFIRSYLKMTGVEIQAEESSMLYIRLQKGQVPELAWPDGRVLAITWDENVAREAGDRGPDLIPVLPGSKALQRMLAAVTRRGQAACSYVRWANSQEPTPGWTHSDGYAPYAHYAVRISYLPPAKKDEIREFTLDLLTGGIIDHLPRFQVRDVRAGLPPRNQRLKRRVSLTQGYVRICHHLQEEFSSQSGDDMWLKTIHSRLNKEVQALDDYYSHVILSDPDNAAYLSGIRDMQLAGAGQYLAGRATVVLLGIHLQYLPLRPKYLRRSRVTSTLT